ncbi:FecR domain-containing protein [Pseudomonas sp. PDM16]|uniref:FecR domain-containing protein n=1 Tax=Pseudomonas sp. PDM16 TaxID=2769292 RepID=UPI0017855FEB|nr:FecR domain-containing protein [Pseudomonas sp. PDM16]MBD9414696.1 FecR domain-containing protein [Pseudomonas sp. PDM16]
MIEPSRATIAAAIDWQLRIESDPLQEAGLLAWLTEDPTNALAWQRLRALNQPFAELDSSQRQILLASHRTARKPLATALALLFASGLGLMILNRQWPLAELTADAYSQTGEIREIELPDHSRLLLGPRSAVDIRFDDRERLVILRRGHIAIETAHEGDTRPFIVLSEDGRLRALGTRFTVRSDYQGSLVTVQRSAVEVRGDTQKIVVGENQQLHLQDGRLGTPQATPPGVDAWTKGMLQVRDQPLGWVIEQLGTYRSDVLTLAPELQGIRVSGSFSLHESDRTLSALEQTLPIRIQRLGPFWTRVVAAPKE